MLIVVFLEVVEVKIAKIHNENVEVFFLVGEEELLQGCKMISLQLFEIRKISHHLLRILLDFLNLHLNFNFHQD